MGEDHLDDRPSLSMLDEHCMHCIFENLLPTEGIDLIERRCGYRAGLHRCPRPVASPRVSFRAELDRKFGDVLSLGATCRQNRELSRADAIWKPLEAMLCHAFALDNDSLCIARLVWAHGRGGSPTRQVVEAQGIDGVCAVVSGTQANQLRQPWRLAMLPWPAWPLLAPPAVRCPLPRSSSSRIPRRWIGLIRELRRVHPL